jgi:hypothetical protein
MGANIMGKALVGRRVYCARELGVIITHCACVSINAHNTIIIPLPHQENVTKIYTL